MTPADTHTPERALGAQRLAQYVARERCERHLRLSLFPSDARERAARYGVSFEALSPLLSVEGLSFERGMVEGLRPAGPVVDMKNKSAGEFVALLAAQAPGRVFYDQPTLAGRIGPWPCDGRADLIRATRGPGGSFDLLVVDFKASRRETVGYRLQVAFYARLLADMLDRAGIACALISGAIASRDAAAPGGEFRPFDLALYLDEIERLVGAPDSDVARVVRNDFIAAAYQVGPHCDGCPYNAVCLVDAAEREDLSLVPLLSAAEKSALRAEDVTTARDLAGLMAYGRGAMVPAPGRAEDVARVGARWPLAGKLPILAQRARAALRRLDHAIEAKPYLFGADYGSLPDEGQYPDLVKIFVDAQRDYLEDRLYMFAALVVGPAGKAEVVRMTPGRPGDESEREMLVSWLQELLPALGRVSDSPSAPLHVYLYDRRGQRALLDTLARHFERLCAIPAFYDLLTSSPALTQGMVSFLAEEVRARLNLGTVCQNLYQVARDLGFKWEAGGREFQKLFSRRVFDNLRAYERDPAGGEFRPAAERAKGAVRIEAAARFGVEIPLEYAYAAWGLLGDVGAEGVREHIRDYVGASAVDLKALAIHRCLNRPGISGDRLY